MTEKSAETIELGNDPSLALDIFRTAKKLEYLLSYTPQYIETLKAVRDLIATDIKVTDKQQKFYTDVERFPRDIVQRVLKMREEEEKDLPVVGRLEATHDSSLYDFYDLVDAFKGPFNDDLCMYDKNRRNGRFRK